MMFWIGMAMAIIGALVGWFGVALNMNTPIQQPLPVVGGVMALIGIGLMLWFH